MTIITVGLARLSPQASICCHCGPDWAWIFNLPFDGTVETNWLTFQCMTRSGIQYPFARCIWRSFIQNIIIRCFQFESVRGCVFVALVCWSGAPEKLLELRTRRPIGQLHRCWFAGASLDNRAATLVCWLGCSGKPGKATRLFIEAVFTAIYRTGGQCGRYSTNILVVWYWTSQRKVKSRERGLIDNFLTYNHAKYLRYW